MMEERAEQKNFPAKQGRVLIVAGSDSGGGAGIQADLKTVTVLGCYGMTAVTALTAQNTLAVSSVYAVPGAFVAEQMRVVLQDIGADAIKIGMLANADIADAVADVLASPSVAHIPVILDPVSAASDGHRLLNADGFAVLKRRLISVAHLVTPNLMEAEALTGIPVHDLDGMRRAAATLIVLGAGNVLIKGGHLAGDMLFDLLIDKEGETIFSHPKIDSRHTHGTGCTLASAVAAYVAQGVALSSAVAKAVAYVQAAIRSAPGLGRGAGPLGVGI